jgi:RNA polymerase sigma factor (sigma-70 family)
MATIQAGTVLRHIRNLAAGRKIGEQSDGALLRAFLSGNDQAAFEALLLRHGPMVLRVCRRVLGNAHDAEDAFQATFLVLAQKAASIRKRGSLASWLHGVAHRMAANLRRAAARQRKHESRAKTTPLPDPALCAAWRELQLLLDEEIGGLPEALRGPFVLCCVQNQTCAEAARQLGLQEGTVWNRLGRARKLLQQRLTRRGVTLPAGLLAVLLGQNTAPAAVPAALVAPTAQAAARMVKGQPLVGGPVSAKVLTLMKGASRAMFLTKGKTTILLLVCTTIVSIGLGMAAVRQAAGTEPGARTQPAPLQGAGEGSKEAPPQPAAREPASAEGKEVITVRGRVMNPDGKPVAGVKLYLGYDSPKKITYPVRATSGDDGGFTFTFPRSELDTTRTDNPKYQVLAVAPGHGCAWGTLDATAAKPLTLRLVKDVLILGRIIDADGRPVVGARLTMTGVAAERDGGQAWLVRNGFYGFAAGKSWIGPLPGQPAVLTTGADGRFKLSGAGLGRIVCFRLEGPGITTVELVVNRASFEHQASVSRPIQGKVRDKETGKPLAGVSVGIWDHPFGNPLCRAVTDREGRYTLLGLAKAATYYLEVKPGDGLYFGRTVGLEGTGGLGALMADIELVRGEVTVRGKVTDKATGKPVAGALVRYQPLAPNFNVNNKLDGVWSPRSETRTGPDGSYALTVFPGPGVIVVRGPNPDRYMPAYVTSKELKDSFKASIEEAPGGADGKWGGVWAVGGLARGVPVAMNDYNAKVLLEPGKKEERLVRDVALEVGQERKGRVVGPDGEPLAGVRIYGRWHHTETSEGGDFTLRRINPKGDVDLYCKHDGKNLGLFLKKLSDEKAGPLIVKLQPCGSVSGRFVDQDGKPLTGTRVGDVTTDKEGRFRVGGLIPGTKHGDVLHPTMRGSVNAGGVVEPGKNKDLGDITIEN